jgi:prophage DNA circulation protein
MSWKDNLIEASFRGASFFVSSSESGVGRRNEIYQFLPDENGISETPLVQDLGEDLNEYRIEGYVIQNTNNNFDYFNQRDSLIFALKSGAAGTLKHPFYGELTVAHIGKARVRESFIDGGIARFSMTFVQVEEAPQPIRTSSPSDKIDEAQENLDNTIADAFANLYESAGVYTDKFAELHAAILQNNITAILTLSQTFVNQFVSEAVGVMAAAINTVDQIVDSPCDIIETISDSVNEFAKVVGLGAEVVTGGVVGLCSNLTRGEVTELDGTFVPEGVGVDTINALLTANSYTGDDITNTPTEQSNNRKLLLDGNSALALGIACRVAIRIDFSSQELLVEVTNDILNSFDTVLESVGDGNSELYQADIYQAIEDMRNILATQMFEKGASITKTVDYVVPAAITTTLNLAYNRYKDIDRDDDIFQRNRPTVKHPGFLPGGETLRILNE